MKTANVKLAMLDELEKLSKAGLRHELARRVRFTKHLVNPKAWAGSWRASERAGNAGILERSAGTLYRMRKPMTGAALMAAPGYVAYRGGKSIYKDIKGSGGGGEAYEEAYAPPY